MTRYLCCPHCPDDCRTPDSHTVPCDEDNCPEDQRPLEVIWRELLDKKED